MCGAIAVLAAALVVGQDDGVVTRMTVAGDGTDMNWLLSADARQYDWVDGRYAWGTGSLRINGEAFSWRRPAETGGVRVSVERTTTGGVLEERYTFANVTNYPVTLTEIDIHTPFNDNFPPKSAEKFNRRCFAHVWPGGDAGWVAASRISGQAPHLGLAVTEGTLSGYELKERAREKGSSDFRGVIALSPADVRLLPGERTSIAWKVFAHEGWDDFFAKLVQLGGADVQAEKYVARVGETVKVTARTAQGMWTRDWTCPGPGDHRVEIAYGADGARKGRVEILGVGDVDELLLTRARYIVRHQLVNDPGGPYDGALVPYDTEAGRQWRPWEWNAERRWVDYSEGGERLGMGVFLAMMAQRGHKAEFLPVLLRYYRFLRESLQESDYTSWQEVRRPTRARAFNYPWFIRFYLEMHALTGERKYLDDAFGTFRRLFAGKGLEVPDTLAEFQIRPLVDALRAAGATAEADEVLKTLGAWLAPSLAFDGTSFVTHEVGFSPDLISSTIGGLVDYGELTGNARYVAAARRWMRSAEANCGRQPSWHAHDIGLHHWDGYWFGARMTWGDTLPHDWNGGLAGTFVRYARATGDASYARRARGIADAMLGLFTPDGRGTCAWIYPDRVNGVPAKGPDPLANDQDWALVYYLDGSYRMAL